MPTTNALLDRLEITELVARLGQWLDHRTGDPAEIYDRDVVVRSPRGEFRGYDAVMAYLTREDPTGERAQHFHSDVLVDLDGDSASVTANQLVQFFHAGEPPHRSSGLRLHYDAVRRPDGWRIAAAEIELQWLIGELPAA
jgi:hypothetical protein